MKEIKELKKRLAACANGSPAYLLFNAYELEILRASARVEVRHALAKLKREEKRLAMAERS
jgi:hypothetical protein